MTHPSPHPADALYDDWRRAADRLAPLQLVFIVGPPKCGTTWMMQLINAHPAALASGESHVFTHLCWPLLAALHTYRRTQVDGLRSKGRPTALSPADEAGLVRTAIERVFLNYLDAHPAKPGLQLIADKSTGHTRHVGLLAQIFPSARFVCCTRDVRDAAVSAWKHLHELAKSDLLQPAATIAQGAEIYARNHWAELLRYARAGGEQAARGRYLEVAYEDHKADPTATAAALFAFLGLDASPDTVRTAVDACRFDRLTGGREAGREAKAFLRKGIVGDWANHFTPEFADFLLRIAAERLALRDQPIDNRRLITWPATIPATPATPASPAAVSTSVA